MHGSCLNTQGVDEIYSRHMIEHLTNNEVLAKLSDWFNSPQAGGKVYIVMLNLDFRLQQ
jgi:predicted SAM-dependent methyltransferase